MTDAPKEKDVIMGRINYDKSDDEFIKLNLNKINFNDADEQLSKDPTKRYLRITTIYDYMDWLRNSVDKNYSIKKAKNEGEIKKNANKKNIKFRLSGDVYTLLYNYSFYGSHPSDRKNRSEVRKLPKLPRTISIIEIPKNTNNKLTYVHESGTFQDIIKMDKWIRLCDEYKDLKIIQRIIIPQYRAIFNIIISKLNKVKDIGSLDNKKISELVSFIEQTEQLTKPFTKEAKKLLEIRKNYIQKLKEYYLKTKDLSKININLKYLFNNTNSGSIKFYKSIILSKYRLSGLKNIREIASIFNSKKIKNDITRLESLKVSNLELRSLKSDIKESLIGTLGKIIDDAKRKINLNDNDLNSKTINKIIVDLGYLYGSTNILSPRDKSSLNNKAKNIRRGIKKKKLDESKENKKQKFEAYLERIKNTTNNINLKSIKNEFGEKSSYFIKLQTALKTRKTKTGNIPFKIYNQIKNEQIKKFKKDGTPYPLDYFKSRYGYTNEQLKILESNYVNKLEDEYKKTDSKYIDELNRTQRQFYSGLINALRKILSGNDKQSYREMVSNALKKRHEKIQALNKEHGSKFSNELKKRRPGEMKILAKRFKSYDTQYKKALRSTKIKLAAKKRASKKK